MKDDDIRRDRRLFFPFLAGADTWTPCTIDVERVAAAARFGRAIDVAKFSNPVVFIIM